MKIFLLNLFVLSLTVLPLQNSLTAAYFKFPGRMLWNDAMLGYSFVLGIFYLYCVVKERKYLKLFSVQISLIFSALLVGIQLLATHSSVTQQFIFLLLSIWSIPFIDYLRTTWGTKVIALLCISILILHSQWAVAQFVTQQDLGLHLLGETRLDPAVAGIAKLPPLAAGDQKIIRAYGPYAHPNTLAGSLIIGVIFLALWSSKLPKSFLYSSLFAINAGILVSFSRSALLASILIVIVTLVKYRAVPYQKLSHTTLPIFVTLCLTIIVFMPFWISRFTDSGDAAFSDRKTGIEWAAAIIKENKSRGVGLGHYSEALVTYLNRESIPYESWQATPVHVVPLLWLAESGWIGASIVAAAIMWFLYKIQSQALWLLPLVPLLLLDHYLLTQVSPLVWLMLLGLVLYSARPLAQLPHSAPATQ